MTLNGDAKFEEKLTCGLENDMRNMASLKIGILMGSFNSKQEKYELQIHRRVMCHDKEE